MQKKRLEFYGYQDKKPVYDKCGLPRYNLENKDYSKSVFNYAVPRMMMQHPLLGL